MFLFNKFIRRYYDRKINQIESALIYLSNKKKFIKEQSYPPLNGQKIRTKIVNKILRSKKIKEIYETGTYIGTTTIFFSKFKISVSTCEISPSYYFIANDRFKKIKNIKIENSNSYEYLKNNLKKTNKNIFFYLDAHNESDANPLLKELDIIYKKISNFIILIDDFLVPHDLNYGFDSDNGNLLNLSYIKKFVKKKPINIYFPKSKCINETGLKRGSVYISMGRECNRLCNSINELIKY